ncbi:MAG: PEP-CTERM sorting domain-containing protein [Planctomycetes bacterium]|nr:PEP-CTERM sorting domain-containing protein [Planctomycetota bacterium]MCG2683204.1 PEP-CTERM sorting domain-containing protein [Planctomycetales bacterium]
MAIAPGSPTSDINYWTPSDTQGKTTWDYYTSSDWTDGGYHAAQDLWRDVMISSGHSGAGVNTRSIAQSFLVSSGSSYDASYYTLKRSGSTATWFDAYLSVDTGTVTGTLGPGSPGILTGSGTNTLKLQAAPGAAWTQLSFSFVPSAGATATLTLTTPYTAGSWASSDVFLDNVRVIPEPGTLALLATGLVGLLCYAWRKRK